MKTIFMTILFIAFLSIASFGFTQEVMANAPDQQKTTSDDQFLERYLLETEKLREKFDPIFEKLEKKAVIQSEYGTYPNYAKWYQEYDLPLFEAVKSSMKRISGTDDYLEMWENRIPERIATLISERQGELGIATENDKTRVVPRRYYSAPITLLALSTLAAVHENQKELTPGIFFHISDEELSSLHGSMAGRMAGGMSMGMGMGSRQGFEPTRFLSVAMSDYFALGPPDRYYGSHTALWNVMAIYSFKSEKARDLLFQMIINTDDQFDSYASAASHYLPFFPKSGELLPEVKALLREDTIIAQRDRPELCKWFFDENDNLIPSSLMQYDSILFDIERGISVRNYVLRLGSFYKIKRLWQLERSLEFNEKIPPEERERFDVFRRELAMSLLLQNPGSEAGTRSIATLKNGDEHFEIYLVEYGGGQNFRNVQWESDDFSYPYSLKNPYWQKRKEFYERELANPREIYTAQQIEYIRSSIKELERFP